MITDHDHVVQRTPHGFVKFGCGQCGESAAEHLSFGTMIAARVGGHPLDYVEGAPPCNGLCVMGNDIMEGGGYYGVVAYPHPDCERHA